MFKKKYFVYAVSMLIVAAGCNTQSNKTRAGEGGNGSGFGSGRCLERL